MNNSEADSSFEALSRELLQSGSSVRFEARGSSMFPTIRDREIVYVTPVIVSKLRKDDIVLTKGHKRFLIHRLVVADHERNLFITRGDSGTEDDPAVRGDQILGQVLSKEVTFGTKRFGKKTVRMKLTGFSGMLLRSAARSRSAAGKILRAAGLRRVAVGFLGLALTLLSVPRVFAQVAVDNTSTLVGLSPSGTNVGTFTHTTSNAANRLLVVSVSMNIANAPGTQVTGITYNGTALTLYGAHNDAGDTRRVEMWYLLAPASGNNLTVGVTVSVPTAGATVGGVAAATTFTGVDQTVPLGTFVSNDGAAGAYSQVDVPSVVNGRVLDALATGGDQTVTVPGPQVTQWNLNSGGTLAQGAASSTGTTSAGAPSVPMSETFSGTSNWSLAAVSINPTSADVGVTTTVGSAVFLGQNTTYNITVKNNGPSAANTVTLKDTLAAGMTWVSTTPSAGVTCTGTAPVTCTIGTLAAGASVTVAVTEKATASGSFANTAVVTDSGTPPDPNTGNNTYVSVATVQSVACGTVAQATAGTNLSGVLNTYYPGTASVAAGATKIPVGTATGAGATIAAGTLLLVIQMQDASIDVVNSVAYGNGYTGQGFTALNSAGDYEFVTATGPIAANSIPIAGAGAGGGLVFAYHSAAWSKTAGQSTYQVVVVPQYTTASFSASAPPAAQAWNGSTGGVLALDASNTLTLNGATVSVDGMGFRGGAGMQLEGNAGGNTTDYLHAAPAAYAGTVENGVDAPKGEGIAGTPLWVQSGGTYLKTTSDYPSGTTGTDGSSARGAPANGGGGGTDGDPAANDQNAGGGGGGNGGNGGFGGDSWSSNLGVGGEGGGAFPATINRVAMGGGGGAGTRNNSDGDNQASGGAAGGGIIIIRTLAISGTGTLTANGISAYNGTSNDAGGGGGAGGSIVVLSADGGESGLTLQANGGNGGNAWETNPYTLGDRHGPGGGGGGGVVLISGTPASISVSGGANGLTENPGVPYGATSGTSGTSVTNASISSTSGTQSGAECTPDVTLSKTHVGNFTRGLTATYTIPVSNVSLYGPTSASVIVNDTLPVGVTPTSASGTGWSCSVASQTVSCANSTVLAANSSYSSITITANVSQSAPATITNTAVVSGGGEVNLANDTAYDVASVISTADLSVTNAASPNPVSAGSNITYTQVATNNGPSAADNATLVEAIPANTTFVSITAPSGWTCSAPNVGATGTVACTDLNMAGSTAGTFSLVVKVNTGVANGTVITDTATVNSSVNDPNSTNNSASASTVVGVASGGELTVSNVASPNPVLAGNNITYTQVVTNTGLTAATGAMFTESTPANTTFVSITPPAGWSCTGFPSQCTDSSVAAGSSGTFTVVYKVAAATPSGTIISDTATVTAGNQGFGSSSALATDVVATAGQADLALATTATPASVIAGNDITYLQTITNNGPAASSNVTFTEALPANTTFASVSAPSGWTCTTTTSVVCTDSTLASGTSADIIVVVNVAATVPNSASPIVESATVSSSTTTDPNSSNNTVSVSTPLVDKCNLTVTDTGTPNPVAAGSDITYTQTVSNGGPSNCTTAVFNEATPANTTFVSLTAVNSGGGTWSCPNAAPVACTSASVAPGSTLTLTAVYTVAAGTAAGTLITDTISASSNTINTNSSGGTATSVISVAGAGQADLSVTNAPTPNPVNAGQNITYTQVVANAGPATASTITLTETLPANTTFVSLSGPAGWTCTSASPYTCTIASLAANANATFTFVVQVSTSATSGSTITDTASVASSTSDPNSGNNSASASVLVAASAGLSVTNSGTPVPVIAGNNITYTQVVSNAGPSAAANASFTETTPVDTTFQSITAPAGWTCTSLTVGTAGTITCTEATMAIGSGTFTFVVKVTTGTAAGTAVNDTATITSSTTDPNSGNNSATAADVVATATEADLVVTNITTPSTVSAGSNVTYTQAVTNDGPAVAGAGATFTQTTPPNTTFQSITPPAGWTCTKPAVGSTGTITCTATGTLAVNSTANFTLVLQVVSTTPSGTNIAETVTATASNIVPGLTTNTATMAVVVANANSADMSIVKTASPSPSVAEGDPLTYTLAVTNNGPANATNVTVIDTLPAAVTYLGVVPTNSCSEAGGTVTCLLGTLNSGNTETVTILTLATTPGSASNTATVSADQADPNPTNNTSTQVETITASTAIKLKSFVARVSKNKNGASQTVLLWKTGGEVHNLGFNVYREQGGERVRLNPSLIAGSALLMSGALPRHSGKTYAWIDSSPGPVGGSYWLEDVDVNGARVMHGPVTAEVATDTESDEVPASSAPLLKELNQAQPASASEQGSHPVEHVLRNFVLTAARRQKQFELAAHHAVKIYVKHEGWYCVTQPELLTAGLDANVDPAQLHLYAEGIEQPVEITGASAGPGGFGSQAALEFYGTGLDSQYSGTRVYWLAAEDTPGLRIQRLQPLNGSNQPPLNYPATVEITPHTTYFSALLTANGNNFFGALVSATPVDQTLQVTHLDTASSNSGALEVNLQGVILGFPHDVTIALNGTAVGDLTFTGQDKGQFQVSLPPGLLIEGANTVTLTAQYGEYDTSLIESVRITYPHSYIADSDRLQFTGRAGDEVKATGFTNVPTVLDITDPDQPVELTPRISSNTTNPISNPAQYTLEVQIPWAAANGSSPARHTLLAVGVDRISSAAGVLPNHPSHWHRAQPGSEIVMVTYEGFARALQALVQAHQAQGQSVRVVPVDELYDEFTFGQHNPYAIRDFLRTATKVWQTPPRYLLLNGRASLDPRNYLGFGFLDFVPTKIVPSSLLMTASDGWFSDFNDTGLPTIATGRLPVSTEDEAALVAGKISTYEGQSTNGSWTSQALMVADVNELENFTQDSQIVQKQLPSTLQVTDVFAANMSIQQAQQGIITAINSGQVLVNYAGHGSEDEWSGDDLFDNIAANALTNGSSLPVFLIMDCLNGFFQDVYEEPLSVTLMLAPNGGAVAVLASSGLNQAIPQTALDSLIVQNVFGTPPLTLGEALLKGKAGIADLGVRRTYNLLGDPAMQIKTGRMGQ